MRIPTSFAALALSLTLASAAHPWPANQQPITLTTSNLDGTLTVVGADGTGGTFVAWAESASPPNTVFRVVHLDSTGTPAPGWTFGGMPVCSLGVAVLPLNLQILPSSGGGAIVIWEESASITLTDLRAYAARVTSGGTIAPGWSVRGLPLSTAAGQLHLSAASDGAGGLLAVWEQPITNRPSLLRAQRLDSNGTRPTGWAALGRNLTTLSGVLDPRSVRRPSLVVDPSNGYWVGFDLTTSDSTLAPASFQVLHLTSSGTPDPDAPENGFALTLPSTLAQDQGIGEVTIVPDGLGGAYIGATGYDREMFVQHCLDAGGEDPNWPPGGVVLSSHVAWSQTYDGGYDPQRVPVSTVDGHGGAWFGWSENDGSWAQSPLMLTRVHDSGGPVIDVPPFVASGGRYPMLVGDANGVFATGWVVWDCPKQSCYGQPLLCRFTTGGTVADGWPPTADFVGPGVPLPGPHYSSHSAMVADGTGSVVAVWNGFPYDTNTGRFVNRFRPVLDATLGISSEARESRVRLGGVWRTGAVLHAMATLGVGPATLEVFDLGGRRLAGEPIAGTGRELQYDLALDRAQASGLVFVRVRQRAAQDVRRLVMIR